MKDERLQRDKVFSRKRSRRKWRGIITCLAAVVVLGTVYSLIHPAITMTKDHPTLAAEELEARSGEELQVLVNVEAPGDGDGKIIVLTKKGEGADLSPSYVFNEEGVCLVTDLDGNEIELHRSHREDGKDSSVIDYWFKLEAGHMTSLELALTDEEDADRFAKIVEAVKISADPEADQTASASNASRAQTAVKANAAAGRATGSNAARNATPANADIAEANAAAKKEEEKVVTEKHDDGFVELLDGAVAYDLGGSPEEETDESEEIVTAQLTLSAGIGNDYDASVRDAAKNASKRGDAELKFTWKEERASALIRPELTKKVGDANIAVICDSGFELPEGAYVDAFEITGTDPSYASYIADAENAVAENEGVEAMQVTSARFFDITIRDAAGTEIHPDGEVRVVITYDKEGAAGAEGDLNLVHFADDGTKVMETDTLMVEKESDAMEFVTDSFSVYGAVYAVRRNRAAGTPFAQIDFFQKDGVTPDPNGELPGTYYLVLTSNYGNDRVALTRLDASAPSSLTPPEGWTPGNGNEFVIVQWNGSDEPTPDYLNSNYWYYDPSGALGEKIRDRGTLGKYTVEFPGSKGADNLYHIKAVKQDKFIVTVRTWDHDGSTPVSASISGDYYVRALLVDKETKDPETAIGWTLTKFQFSGGTSTDIVLDKFVAINANPQHGQAITWDPSKYEVLTDISSEDGVRLVRLKDQNQIPNNYAEAKIKDQDNKGVDDNPPAGFAYIAGQVTDDGYQVNLKKADDIQYHVRLKFDTTDTGEISIPDGLYARVTIRHEGSGDTYGFVKVTKDNLTVDNVNECTYIDVPITQWVDSSGNPVTSEVFTGNEKGIKVELTGIPDNVTPVPVAGYALEEDKDHVNRFRVTDYPDTQEAPERITEKAKDKDYTTNMYDVVTLEKNTDKFNGYTLEYILNGYNVVTLCPNETVSPSDSGEASFGDGDFLILKHQMGGVLVRGDIIRPELPDNKGVADSELINKPSVIGGYVPVTGAPFIHNRHKNPYDWNGYVGSVNTAAGNHVVNGVGCSEEAGDGIRRGYTATKGGTTVVSDDYIDWDRLQRVVTDTSKALAEEGGEDLYRSGQTVYTVQAGSNVVINYPEGETITINVIGEGSTPEDLMNMPPTVVSNTGSGTYKAVKVMVNGSGLNTTEDGKGISLLWNYPNAEEVNVSMDVTPQFGHIVAPKAFINIEGGNNSGCMVGNKVRSAGEGHLYPYKGDTILGIYGKIISGKTVNNGTPAARQKYDFILEKLDPVVPVSEYNKAKQEGKTDRAIFWKELQTVQNQGGNISFDDIHFPKAGDYWFMVSEDTSGQKQGETFDETKYLVYVKVVNDADAGTVKIEGNDVKIYRINDIENLLTIGDVSEATTVTAKKAEINYNVITRAADIAWVVKGSTIESGIIFGNKVADASVTFSGTKTLEGQTLTEGQFTFTVKDAAESVVATGKNKADGSIVFTPITYSSSIFVGQPTAELEFTYKVTEDMPGATEENQYTVNGIKYDPSVKTEKVKVTLNDDGTISAERVTEGSDPIAFANKVDTGSLEITKKVTVGGNPTTTDVADGTYTFRVYDAENKLAKKANGKPVGDISITITGGRSNSAAVDGLAPGTYYVMEISADNKQIELDTKAKQVIVSSSATGKAEITNNIVQIEIPVEKRWSFVEKSRVFRSLVWPTDISVEVELLKSDSPNGPWSSFDPKRTVVLSAGKMKDKFTGLDKKDVNGNAIYYNVKELRFIGTKPGFDPANFITSVNGNETEGFVITNEEQPRGLTVVKSFQGDDLTDAEKNRITFTVSGPGLENGSLTKSYADFTNGSWTLTGDDGIIIGQKYTVEETNADVKGYKRTTKVRVNEDGEEEILSAEVTVSSETGKGSVQFINTYEKEPIEISGQKTWRDGGRTHKNAEELTLKLYRTASPSNAESVWEEVSYDKETQLVWNGRNSYRITGLEPFGTDSSSGVLTPYAYRVEEGPMNTETPYMQETDPQHQNSFINTELTEAEVKKEWKLVASESDARKPVTVTLYRGEGTDRPVGYITLDGTPGIEPEDSGVKGWEDAAWHAKWTNLPKYESDGTTLIKYTVRETEGADGFTVSYPREEGYALSGESILNAELTAFDFTKKWQNIKGDDQNTWPEGKEIVVKIVRIAGNEEDPDFALVYRLNAGNYSSKDGIEPDRDQSKGTERPKLTFRKDTAFSFHLEGLTKFDGEKTYEYYVSETNQVDGYEKPQYFDKTGKQVEEGKGLVGHMAPDGGTIVNTESAGYELPSTGGPGTVLYTVSGLLLTGAAIIYSLMKLAGRIL